MSKKKEQQGSVANTQETKLLKSAMNSVTSKVKKLALASAAVYAGSKVIGVAGEFGMDLIDHITDKPVINMDPSEERIRSAQIAAGEYGADDFTQEGFAAAEDGPEVG